MGLLRVLGNQDIKKMSLKIEKHRKDCDDSFSALSTISSLISKALSDDSISDEEYSRILLEFDTFTRMKEDLRIKSKTSLENIGNIETEASDLFNRNMKYETIPTWTHVQNHDQNHVQNHGQNHGQNHAENYVQTVFKTVFKTTFETLFETMFEKLKWYVTKTCHFYKLQIIRRETLQLMTFLRQGRTSNKTFYQNA